MIAEPSLREEGSFLVPKYIATLPPTLETGGQNQASSTPHRLLSSLGLAYNHGGLIWR
jgi:hypothetical protein